MMRPDPIDRAGESNFADRLALTSKDRRLESMVLMEMIRGSGATLEAEPTERGAAPETAPRGGASASRRSIYEHAVGIASYLSRAYGMRTLEQKMLLCELAVEIAVRIDEEIHHIQDPSPTSPRE